MGGGESKEANDQNQEERQRLNNPIDLTVGLTQS